MRNSQGTESNDTIDLRELFMSLWAYKFLIVGTCALGIVYGGNKALNVNKEFISSAIFKYHQEDGSGMGRSVSSLAKITGFSVQNDSVALPIDQVTGRVFIEKLDKKLKFQADPYFNTYNPNAVEPIWKSYIRSVVGLKKPLANTEEAIWQSIAKNYSNSVKLSETEKGRSVKIEVTHLIPERAAEIANTIMTTIIQNAKDREISAQDQKLSYLSRTLAKALTDLETTQSDLKEFTLENSALPLESFAAESLALDALRDQLSRTSALHDAVGALSVMLQNKTTAQDDYLALREQFPIVDQVEFRRVMGQNEIISSWTWPEASSVKAVFDTLLERKNRLQSQIDTSQKDAERSSLTLETYAKLTRDARFAEATYTVMIEQVKAQSVVAGYQQDQTEIYEYASASISPSGPNRKMILAFGAVLGLFFGTLISLILAFTRGVYYSKKSLRIGSQAPFMASSRSLLSLRNKSLNDINIIFAKKPYPILRNIAVGIHKNATSQVIVTSSRAKLTSVDAARALASYIQSETVKVAIIDFSSKAKKLDTDNGKLTVGSFVVTESAKHISVLSPNSDMAPIDFLIHKNFWENTQSLNSTFDLVFLCADNVDAISLLNAVEGQKAFHITLARTKKTKSATLLHMRSLLPIQGLLHD